MAKHRKIKQIVLHCTGSDPEWPWTVEGIKKAHQNKGWSDIGYHYIVLKCGTKKKGRLESKRGAHVRCQNDDSIAIAYMGGLEEDKNCRYHKDNDEDAKCTCVEKDTRTPEQKKAICELIEDIRKRHQNCCGPIILRGHRDYNKNKDCPGFDVLQPISVRSVSWVDGERMPHEITSLIRAMLPAAAAPTAVPRAVLTLMSAGMWSISIFARLLFKKLGLDGVFDKTGETTARITARIMEVNLYVTCMIMRAVDDMLDSLGPAWREQEEDRRPKQKIQERKPHWWKNIKQFTTYFIFTVWEDISNLQRAWPDLACLALGITANYRPPDELQCDLPEGGYKSDSSKYWLEYRAMTAYEYWPADKDVARVFPDFFLRNRIKVAGDDPSCHGWTPPAIPIGFSNSRKDIYSWIEKNTYLQESVRSLKIAPLGKYAAGENSKCSEVRVGEYHPHSFLKKHLHSSVEILIDVLVKVRIGHEGNLVGILYAGSPKHAPWVWCEHALTKEKNEYFLYLAGSKFPSHALFANGRKILEIESKPLAGNEHDDALDAGATWEDLRGNKFQNPPDGGEEEDKLPVNCHRYTVGAWRGKIDGDWDENGTEEYVRCDVTKYIEECGMAGATPGAADDEYCQLPPIDSSREEDEEARGEQTVAGPPSAPVSPVGGALRAAGMRVSGHRPILDPPEFEVRPEKGAAWDGKGKISVANKTAQSIFIGGPPVLSGRLDFSVVGCTDGKCFGSGAIEPAGDAARVGGQGVLLETDEGSCSGLMVTGMGPPVRCRCKVAFKTGET